VRKPLKLPLGLLIVAALAATGPPAEARDRFHVGGGFGLGFGDITFVDLSGVIAYNVVPRVTTGLRLTWRAREDNRIEQSVTTNDYGAALFARYMVKKPFFVHAEYEYLSYESISSVTAQGATTNRYGYDSFLVGGGAAHPLSKHATLFVTALYNLTYDSSELRRPYDSPWIFRAGVGFTF
jgi:hypothetical protein